MKRGLFSALTFLFLVSIPVAVVGGGAYPYRLPPEGPQLWRNGNTVVGVPVKHTVTKEENLIDIARDHDLGFNELADLYPQLDPWIPPPNTELIIPSQWVLPDTRKEGIVANIPELRLYYFMKRVGLVKTFPIGIGDDGWHTPLGIFLISTKMTRPTWYIPESLQEKYEAKTMPPGPDNPLGDYWMGLSDSSFGIHGTNFPWSVGRLVTHGCIRLYPEDIENLFSLVEMGTPVEIIYEPVKFGFRSGRIYVEVHRDIYNRIGDFTEYGWGRLKEKGLAGEVDHKKLREALREKNGLPVDVTRLEDSEPGGSKN